MTVRNPQVGEQLGRYRLLRELGRGGMGVVYLALDTHLERHVALKLIAAEISEDAQFQSRFTREMRIAAQLEHPNVVPVYEAGELESFLFIAMRHIDGEDLRARLRRDGAVGSVIAGPIRLPAGCGSGCLP